MWIAEPDITTDIIIGASLKEFGIELSQICSRCEFLSIVLFEREREEREGGGNKSKDGRKGETLK